MSALATDTVYVEVVALATSNLTKSHDGRAVQMKYSHSGMYILYFEVPDTSVAKKPTTDSAHKEESTLLLSLLLSRPTEPITGESPTGSFTNGVLSVVLIISSMGDTSLDSDGVAVASKEDLSLFDEEILFDDDPNNAYFKFLVAGLEKDDDFDDSLLTGDSSLENLRDFSTPVDVQKRWIRMACDALGSDADDTLENVSLPRGLDNIPAGVFDNVEVERKFQTVSLPPVVYIGQEVSAKEKHKKPTEQAPEQAPELASALSTLHAGKTLLFGSNRRTVITILVFFFLFTTIGLAVTLSMFSHRLHDDGANDPTNTSAGRVDGSPDVGEESPMAAPAEQEVTSPTMATTSAPSLRRTTAQPTMSPTASYTSPSTAVPTVSPTLVPSTLSSQSPSTSPTVSLPFVPEELIAMLSSISPDGGAALSNHSSHQFFAAQWLSNVSGFGFYSDQTKIQRYALATLYLSTSGYQWTNSQGWLTEQDECDWFNDSDYNGRCVNGELGRLYLHFNNLQGTLPPELALLSNSLSESFAL